VNYKTNGSHWVIDSGCTQHMTGDPHMFTSLDEDVDGQERITFGDNSKGKVQGLGKLNIKCAICRFIELRLDIHLSIV
jgi:hypothetical protein